MSAELNSLGMAIFLARHCGTASRMERERLLSSARHAVRAYFRRSLAAGNLPLQREGLNRRQRKAERQGIAVLRRGEICGIPFAVQPWGCR